MFSTPSATKIQKSRYRSESLKADVPRANEDVRGSGDESNRFTSVSPEPLLFRFWVLPEHDCHGDYRDHHDRTRRQEQVGYRWLVHLFQFRR
jgi:hypothetical protein